MGFGPQIHWRRFLVARASEFGQNIDMDIGTKVVLQVTERESGFAVGSRGVVVERAGKYQVLVRFEGDTRPCPQIVNVSRLLEVL